MSLSIETLRLQSGGVLPHSHRPHDVYEQSSDSADALSVLHPTPVAFFNDDTPTSSPYTTPPASPTRTLHRKQSSDHLRDDFKRHAGAASVTVMPISLPNLHATPGSLSRTAHREGSSSHSNSGSARSRRSVERRHGQAGRSRL